MKYVWSILLAGLIVGCTKDSSGPTSVQISEMWESVARSSEEALYLIGYRSDSTRYEGEQVRLVGTGFAVGEHQIVTNAHVVNALLRLDDSLPPIAVRAGNTVSSSSILSLKEFKIHPRYTGSYASADLAILRVEEQLPFSLPLASDAEMDSLRAGSSIATMGFPGETIVWSLTEPTPSFKEGTISSVHSLDKPDTANPHSFFLQHNLDLTGGTSGSPIFNVHGNVIAVNNSGVFYTAIGYGITSSYLDTLLGSTEYDTFSTYSMPEVRRFTDSRSGASVRIDGMKVGAVSFSELKGHWGYDYNLVVENDSIRVVEYTDYESYRVLAFVEKADWYSRNRDLCVMFLLTNIPGQNRLNSFSHYIYDDILVGASKTGIQLHFGICNTRPVAGKLCAYEYAANGEFYYPRRGVSFLFFEDDSYCSAIALYAPDSAGTPHFPGFDASLITRYGSGESEDFRPPEDTTVTLKYASGAIMSRRTYKDGKLEGTVEEFDESGALRLNADFSGGKKHGVVKGYDSTGVLRWLRTYSLDTLNGLSANFYGMTAANDTQSVRMFRDGEFHGPAREYYESGGLAATETFVNGLLEDTSKTFHINGNLWVTAVYDSGKLDGQYVEYYSGGQVKMKGTYKDSLKHGLFIENKFANDTLLPKSEETYENGKLEGVAKYYSSSGSLLSIVPFENGKKHGTVRMYYQDGTLMSEKEYQNGVLHGVSEFYRNDGTISKKETWEYNRRLRTVYYNPDGTVQREVDG